MPNCNKCESEIPSRYEKDGKIIRTARGRKYCFDCSPIGSHNTRKLEIEDKTDKECICQKCGKPYVYSRKRAGTLTKCGSCLVSEHRQKRKQKAVEYKGGKCQIKDCGYDRCIEALEFHHLDSKEKDFGWGDGVGRKWEVQKKELDKCIMVCANCHREIHVGLIEINVAS